MILDEIDCQIEEISADEVNQIVAALNALQRTAASVTIREFLEDCATNIHYLVHDDECGDFNAAA